MKSERLDGQQPKINVFFSVDSKPETSNILASNKTFHSTQGKKTLNF